MPHINILYSGYGNIGDEMILVGTLNALKRLGLEHARIYDFYERPPPRLLMITRKELKDLRTEYVGVNELLGFRARRISIYAQTALGLILPINAAFRRVVRERDAYTNSILWHKGVSGYDSYHGTRMLAVSITSTASIASRFPVAVLGGLSMGYTETAIDRELVKNFLRYWHIVMLREPYSFIYVKMLIDDRVNCKLYLVRDFAIFAERMPTKTSEKAKNRVRGTYDDKPVIGLILRDYYYQRRFPTDTRTRYIIFIKKLVKAIESEGYKTILIPMGYLYGRENDVSFMRNLLSLGFIDNCSRVFSGTHLLTPGEFIDALSALDMVISVRTHGFIASALAGIPAIYLYYEHKGAGISKFTFGVNGLNLLKCIRNDDECIREIKRVIEDRHNVRKDLYTRVLKAREYNYKLLKEEIMPAISFLIR